MQFENFYIFITSCFQNPPRLDGGGSPHGRVFMARTPDATSGGDDDEEKKKDQEERQKTAETKRKRMAEIERAQLDPYIKQKMREALASGNVERENLVDRVLHKEVEPEAFREELEGMEREEKSWGVIFETQREIRKKIQNLQLHAESYSELVPRRKLEFEALIKDTRELNRKDDKIDRALKNTLHDLMAANAQKKTEAVLNPAQAREIYGLNPLMDYTFEKTLDKYKKTITAAENRDGNKIFRTILALKKEEAMLERRFNSIYKRFNDTVQRSLRKVRSKAERERLLDTASGTVGITLKEGVTIKYREPDILAVSSTTNKVKIKRVEFKPVEIRDHDGKVIDEIPGVPYVTLSNGASMPLGRFKKWVDAVDAVEDISTISEIEDALDLAPYGIKVKPGLELSYARKRPDEQGRLISTPTLVRITEIKDGRIYFNEPVLFQPGFEQGASDYDMRESLTYAEFVKWWKRYEVEKSVSLHELQDYLRIYNELENKRYGIDADENLPIQVAEGEMLRYPDDSGDTFVIQTLGATELTLDSGEKFTFPEFFSWVKNNHVQHVKETAKTPEELAEETLLEKGKREFEAAEEAKTRVKEAAAHHRLEKSEKFAKERQAGSLSGSLKALWWNTQFLSLQDLWAMTMEVVEFVKRKHDRRSKGRYGDVGSRLPGVLGAEFDRVKQSAENEEVNKYKEAMEHWSIEKVKRVLHETNNIDNAKACIMTLVSKGEMRWDDHEFWKTLNRLTQRYTTRGHELYIPEPHLIPPRKSGEDMSIRAMDALWGDGTGSEWFMENTSKYNSNKNNFEYKFKQLENDPKGTGGPTGELHRLLGEWLEGGYVNPQDYEAMLDGAIKFGKMTAEGKMFYLFAGVLGRQGNKDGKNPHGETLLHMDRLGEIDSKYLNNFPLLDFFTQAQVPDPALGKDAEGKTKTRKLQLSDLQEMADEYFADDLKKGEPGSQFSRFMWEVMLMNDQVRTRISKGIRNAENMDHDDAHLYIPPTTPSEIDSLTTGPSGQKKYFTNAGYMNGYPGFNHWMVSLSYAAEDEKDEEAKKEKIDALRDAMNAFIRYDAILDNRLFKDEGDKRARLDAGHYSKLAVVDRSVTVGIHQAQMRNMVVEIGRAYGQDWDKWLYGAKTGSILDKKELEKQKEYERRIDGLKDVINRLVASDGGAKALEVIRRLRSASNQDGAQGLRGIVDSKRPPPDDISAMRAHARQRIATGATAGGY